MRVVHAKWQEKIPIQSQWNCRLGEGVWFSLLFVEGGHYCYHTLDLVSNFFYWTDCLQIWWSHRSHHQGCTCQTAKKKIQPRVSQMAGWGGMFENMFFYPVLSLFHSESHHLQLYTVWLKFFVFQNPNSLYFIFQLPLCCAALHFLYCIMFPVLHRISCAASCFLCFLVLVST